MPTKRDSGDNRKVSKTATPKSNKNDTRCTTRGMLSRRNPEEDEESTILWVEQNHSSCSKKTSQCQTNPLNPYRAARSPGDEDEGDEDEDDEDEDEEEGDEEEDEDVDDELSSKKSSPNASRYGQNMRQPQGNNQQKPKKK
jgi:hypothetical protein